MTTRHVSELHMRTESETETRFDLHVSGPDPPYGYGSDRAFIGSGGSGLTVVAELEGDAEVVVPQQADDVL